MAKPCATGRVVPNIQASFASSLNDEMDSSCFFGRCQAGSDETRAGKQKASSMKRRTLGIDLAKDCFQVSVSNSTGKVSERHRFNRTQFTEFIAQVPVSRILLEACGTARHCAAERGRLERLLCCARNS